VCSNIVEQTSIFGSGKGAQGWFELRQANVYYDHPFHAPLEHALTIDFVNPDMGPSARVAVEMSADSARELVRCIQAALASGADAHLAEGPMVAISVKSMP